MSVTVMSIYMPQRPTITSDIPHVFQVPFCPVIDLVKDDVPFKMMVKIRNGFKCDGASIPWMFRWFLPSWAEGGDVITPYKNLSHPVLTSDVYNVGSCIHDGLYIHKGFGIFSREECDDILRGIWRCSGISRFKAGVADKAVEWFAGGSRHWGNDSYNVGELFGVEI